MGKNVAAGVDVVVLAGGRASRLAALNVAIPKALLPVCGRPFALWQADAVLAACPGVRRIFYSIQPRHMPLFGDILPKIQVPAHLLPEESPMGTGGAILGALSQKDMLQLSDPFLVLNGDVLFDMDPVALVQAAASVGAAMHGIRVPDALRFGCIERDEDRVAALTAGRPGAGMVNAGMYAFTHGALADFPSAACSFEFDIAPCLVSQRRMGLIVGSGPFIDIGTPESYRLADGFIASFTTAHLKLETSIL